MEIEIISTENIKPSSPTPQNLRTYKISLLDQITPPVRFPIILYFPHNKNTKDLISESTKTLKQSLSKLLTRFYPFAGRIKDHLSVDCTDEGFLFVVAKVKSSLTDFLKKPDQKVNTRLIPCKLDWSEAGPGSHVALAQVNYFDCGGIAIGFVFSHKVADGLTMCSFIKSWSLYAAYNGCAEVVCPNYIAQSFFLQNDAMETKSDMNSTMMSYLKIGKTVMRRYVFDSRAISTLKAKSSDIYRLSRVEVVTTFLWKCFMLANKSSGKLTLVTQGVNLRRKAQPPLPENLFGNFFWLAAATSKHKEGDNGEVEKKLVMKLRDEVNKIDDDFITRMHGDNGLSGYYRNVEETWGRYPDKESAEVLAVSSWCNFGLYNVDFGWGKPIWLNNCCGGNELESPYINAVWLIDTKNGDGVEAWVTLEEQYMREFDDIEELRVLASVDPNPFDI